MKTIQTETIDPALLIITRDGELDGDYYDQIYAEKRRQAIHMAGREALDHVRELPQKIVDIAWAIADHIVEDARTV